MAGNQIRRTFFVVQVTFFVTLLAFLSVLAGPSKAQGQEETVPPEKVLATGEGFQITQKDVMDFRKFFDERTVYRTTPEHYLKACVRYRLFSLEAMALKLHELGEAVDENTLEGVVRLADRYVAWRQDAYRVPETAIVSYYRANPDLMAGRLLDEALRYEIRQKILSSRKQREEWQAFDELTQKFKVRFWNSKTGKFEES